MGSVGCFMWRRATGGCHGAGGGGRGVGGNRGWGGRGGGRVGSKRLLITRSSMRFLEGRILRRASAAQEEMPCLLHAALLYTSREYAYKT